MVLNSKRSLLRLSLGQLVFILLVFTITILVGSFISYGFGLREGYTSGFDHARTETQSFMARLPVEGSLPDTKDLDKVTNDVYARLSLREMVAPKNDNISLEKKLTEQNSHILISSGSSQNQSIAKAKSLKSTNFNRQKLRTPFEVYKSGELPKGWFVQVAAPSSEEKANEMGTSLRGLGFPVAIENAMVREREYYRVLIGPEISRKTAERLVKQLQREKVVTKSPFIRLIR